MNFTAVKSLCDTTDDPQRLLLKLTSRDELAVPLTRRSQYQ